jgi:hypothetical protein
LWRRVAPAVLKFLRVAVTVCEGIADEIFETIVAIASEGTFPADLQPRFTRAVTEIADALAHPETRVEVIVEFARNQLWRAQEEFQTVDERCAAIEDVRNCRADFDNGSIELAILRLLRSLARSPAYPNVVCNLLRELYQSRTPFLSKMALVLAADHINLKQPDMQMLAETVAFCMAELEQESEFRYIAFTVLGIGFLQRVFDIELFKRFVNMFVEMLQTDVGPLSCSAGLVAVLMGVIGYDGIEDMSAPIALLIEHRASFTCGLATWLFPDSIVCVVTALLQKIGPLSRTVGWDLALELTESSELSDEDQERVALVLRLFEEQISQLQATTDQS